jgi:hypothetical protein
MADFTHVEFKVACLVCRYTFGFHRHSHRMSFTFICEKSGLCREAVNNAIHTLGVKGFLLRKPTGDSFEYSLNFDDTTTGGSMPDELGGSPDRLPQSAGQTGSGLPDEPVLVCRTDCSYIGKESIKETLKQTPKERGGEVGVTQHHNGLVTVDELQKRISKIYNRTEPFLWSQAELCFLVEVSRRPLAGSELFEITKHREKALQRYYAPSVLSLLEKWTQWLDIARNKNNETNQRNGQHGPDRNAGTYNANAGQIYTSEALARRMAKQSKGVP